MESDRESAATGCCPRFDPAPWDETEVELRDRPFVRCRVHSFFHIPLDFGRVMKRAAERIEAAGAAAEERLVLSDETSLWGADVYIAVSREVPGADNVRLSGKFLSRVFEGPYREIRSRIEAMRSWVTEKGQVAQKLYFFYTTCPRCARLQGKNYVVILAQV